MSEGDGEGGTNGRDPIHHQLETLCNARSVVTVLLTDGTSVAAVCVGVSSASLILDRWNEQSRESCGDPFVVDLDMLDQIVIS